MIASQRLKVKLFDCRFMTQTVCSVENETPTSDGLNMVSGELEDKWFTLGQNLKNERETFIFILSRNKRCFAQ